MKTCAWLLLIALVAPLVLGNVVTQLPTEWVDPNMVQGRLLAAVDCRVGLGIAGSGRVTDEPLDMFALTLTGPAGLSFAPDPNGAYDWAWWPTAAQEGVHYLVLRATETLAYPGGPLEEDVATYALRVLPANRPPVITHGGCRILSK